MFVSGEPDMGRATLLVGVMLPHVLFTHESVLGINADNSAAYTECATSYKKTCFFWQNTESCKERKVVAKYVSSLCLGRAVTALRSLRSQ